MEKSNAPPPIRPKNDQTKFVFIPTIIKANINIKILMPKLNLSIIFC